MEAKQLDVQDIHPQQIADKLTKGLISKCLAKLKVDATATIGSN